MIGEGFRAIKEVVEIILEICEYIYMKRYDKVKEYLEDNNLPKSTTKFIKDFLCDVFEADPNNKELEDIIGDEYAERFMKNL